jgi:hypothetical protein
VTTAKLGDSSVSLAKLTATGTKSSSTFLRGDNTFDTPPLGGITMADEFRLTSAFSGSQNPITNNVERVDSTGQGQLGTGMSVSSGIFTFPTTGYYLVVFNTEHYLNSNDREINGRIKITTNNSSYSDVARGATHINGVGANTHAGTTCFTIVDVTDTTNVKVAFRVTTDNSNTNTVSDTNTNTTSMIFIRLGDT